jgi:hypothetical protein
MTDKGLKQPSSQAGATAGTTAKERVESTQDRQELTPITEFTRKVDLEPEVEGWLEKLEKEESQLAQPVLDKKGKVVLQDVTQQAGKFKVVLPLTQAQVKTGLRHKVVDSLRWLAEWCVRMIKMFGQKVAYRRQRT